MRRLDDPYYRVSPARETGLLDVGGGHQIYWAESGNPQGMPLLILHGGPGGASSDGHRVFTDPQKFRILQFDQRGCGKSTPAGKLQGNSLQHTVADIERLRALMGIEQWAVTGGSWGSCVAVAYAEAHPTRCLGLLLVSTWLCRVKDTDWWFQGVRTVFPEVWEQFASCVPANKRPNLLASYCDAILHGADTEKANQMARQLYLYEEAFMRFEAPMAPPPEENAIRYGRIFAHYASNGFFLKDTQLLEDAMAIADLPVEMVTGRYDMCTTPDNAFDLKEKLPNAVLTIVPGAGHNPMETALARACVGAAERLYKSINSKFGSVSYG